MIHSNYSQDALFGVLSGLASQVRRVETALQPGPQPNGGPREAGEEEDERFTRNLRQFVRVADKFHSSASTIVREGPRSTVWGGSILGTSFFPVLCLWRGIPVACWVSGVTIMIFII